MESIDLSISHRINLKAHIFRYKIIDFRRSDLNSIKPEGLIQLNKKLR